MGDTTAVVVVAFEIGYTALYGGIVWAIFLKVNQYQKIAKRVPEECCYARWSWDLEFTIQRKVISIWKKTDTSLYIAPKTWSHKGIY
jgi:hypothetical protein